MSRGIVTIVLLFAALLVWFWVGGQALQSVEIAFVLGLIIGTLFGWWSGGYRVLRKQHKDDVQSAHTKYDKNKEKYL